MIKPKPQVIIQISGGNIISIISSTPTLDVYVVDWDNIDPKDQGKILKDILSSPYHFDGVLPEPKKQILEEKI
jgi:hypothetical protein